MRIESRFLIVVACAALLTSACSGGSDSNDNPQIPTANVENTKDLCSDNLDNDDNGLKDCEDAGCQEFTFCQQTEEGKENTLAACQDGIDNDGDNLADCLDQDCSAFAICNQTIPETPVIENTVQLCSDNVDNDNNGTKDCDDANCKTFSMCDQAEEGKENTLASCMDHADNDGDGKTDCDDEECKDFTICNQTTAENTAALCSDKLDNDGDGKADCDDTECALFTFCKDDVPPGGGVDDGKSENTVATCYFDGIDNDGDTLIDCDDPNCKIFSFCQYRDVITENTLETCQDGKDNDEDGKADCLDSECMAFLVCQPEPESPKENTAELCSDGEDNDKDGNIDCIDPDCWGFNICSELVGVVENTRELCSDGKDNDFNGTADKDDPNCALFYAGGGKYGENTVDLCKDGEDKDGDGLKDCDDPECQVYDFCMDGYKAENDECKEDPFKFKKDKCACGETLVGDECYKNLTKENFSDLEKSKNKFIQKQDIDFGETDNFGETDITIDIFKGTLDGNHKRITGVFHLKAKGSSATNYSLYCGLIRKAGDSASPATFKNMDIAITLNCDNTAEPDLPLYAGAISGYLTGKASNITGSSKVFVEEPKEKSGTVTTIGGQMYKAIGGLFGMATDGALSDIRLTGNVSAYLNDTSFKSSSTGTKYYYIYIGGAAGYAKELSNIEANNYITLKRKALTTGAVVSECIGGVAGYVSGNVNNANNRGIVKFLPLNYHSNYSYVGGVVGRVFGGNMKNSSFNGVIETNTILPSLYPSLGGIVGKMSQTTGASPDNNVYVVDHCRTNATLRVLGQTYKIGGILGNADSVKRYIRNCSSTIELELLNLSSSEQPSYGGIAGYVSDEAYVVNNFARTHHIQSSSTSTSSTYSLIGGIVGGIDSIVVNNFASDKLTCAGTGCAYTPKSIGGKYVYESYWNKDVTGTESGASTYSDASAEPYTYNLEGIPVTRGAKTVLGLLRYNSGHDGGVLSAHIPGNTEGIYYDWTTEVDDDGHVNPVPADK